MKVLLTGPSGRLGPHLVAPFRDLYDLRTFDLKPSDEPNSFVGDLSEIEPLRAAMQGCDAVIHLAATADEAPFVDELVQPNIVGVYNALEAARLENVRRFVFASSVQTVGNRGRDGAQNVEPDEVARPNSLYGATKVMGEMLGRWFHDKHGIEFVGLRIGAFQPYDSSWLRDNIAPNIWLSPRDAVQIFQCALETPDVGWLVVNATSAVEKPFLSLQSAREILGYEPQDHSRDFFTPASSTKE